MWVELLLPEEVASALPPAQEAEYTERGPSDISVALEVVGTVSNVVTAAQVVKAAPELARRIRAWLRGRAERAGGANPDETPRLVVKAPGLHIEVELPPNVPAERIAAALLEALEPENQK